MSRKTRENSDHVHRIIKKKGPVTKKQIRFMLKWYMNKDLSDTQVYYVTMQLKKDNRIIAKRTGNDHMQFYVNSK